MPAHAASVLGRGGGIPWAVVRRRSPQIVVCHFRRGGRRASLPSARGRLRPGAVRNLVPKTGFGPADAGAAPEPVAPKGAVRVSVPVA